MRENARSGRSNSETPWFRLLLRLKLMSARSSCAFVSACSISTLTPVRVLGCRDQRRENSVRARRANRLLLLRLGAIDRQREARAIPDERAVDVPGVLPRLPGRTLARERVARVHRVVPHVHVEGVAPAAAAGPRAHFDARAAIAAAGGIVVTNADFLNLRAGRQPAARESVDANVGVLADELLQHLRELFGIVRQRGELLCGQLLGERAEQLRVFIGRQDLDLLGHAGNLHHDVAARLRAGAHPKILHLDGGESGKFDARHVIAGSQSVEHRLAALVRDRVSRDARSTT